MTIVTTQPLLIAIVALYVIFTLIEPRFGTAANMVNIGIQASILIIAATGMTLVIMTGGIDISVGAMLYLGTAVITMPFVAQMPAVGAILVVTAAIALAGVFNGVGVALLGIPAMIMTLATQMAFRGLGSNITSQRTISVGEDFRALATGSTFGVANPILVALVTTLVGYLLLRRTVFGRYVQAIGSSESASRNAGLPQVRTLVAVYGIAGAYMGVAAFIQAGRIGVSQPGIGDGLELTVITAVVIGGASLAGGKGSILGSVLGAIVLTQLENGLVLAGLSSYVFDIIRGMVLLIAILGAWKLSQRRQSQRLEVLAGRVEPAHA